MESMGPKICGCRRGGSYAQLSDPLTNLGWGSCLEIRASDFRQRDGEAAAIARVLLHGLRRAWQQAVSVAFPESLRGILRAVLALRRPRPMSRALGYACASERRWASSALKGSRLAIPLRPLSRLAQDEEPRYAGGEAGGG